MLLCEKEDVKLAALIVERYNLVKEAEIRDFMSDETAERINKLDEQIGEMAENLYASEDEEADMIEVPIELFHRMAAEVEHHKAMLSNDGSGRSAGLVATLGCSMSGEATYGVAKDLQTTMRVRLRAPDGADLTDEALQEVVDCAVNGYRATLTSEMETLRAERDALAERFKSIN